MTSRYRDRGIVSLLEDAICTQELTLTYKLAAGLNGLAEQAALTELHHGCGLPTIFRRIKQANRPSGGSSFQRWIDLALREGRHGISGKASCEPSISA
jgi:hypothetical protein